MASSLPFALFLLCPETACGMGQLGQKSAVFHILQLGTPGWVGLGEWGAPMSPCHPGRTLGQNSGVQAQSWQMLYDSPVVLLWQEVLSRVGLGREERGADSFLPHQVLSATF